MHLHDDEATATIIGALTPTNEGGTLAGTASRTALILTAVTALVIGALVPATAAWADAALVFSSPAEGEILAAAPSSVELTFNAPLLEGAKSEIQVTGPDGSSVVAGDTAVEEASMSVAIDADQEGAYEVIWQTTSDDGHAISDTFKFGVGEWTVLDDSDSAGADPGQNRPAVESAVLIGVAVGIAALAITALIAVFVARRRRR